MGTFLVVLLVIAGIIAAVYLLPWQVQVVSEEERLVIYRLGRFNRIAGPGMVYMSKLETVHHKIDARDKPRNVRVDNLFMRGVPFGYTLNFWYRVDPVTAASDDKEQLAHLAHFDDHERDKLVGTKVREALVLSTTQIGNEYKPAGEAYFYNILPIIPGLPDNDRLLALTRDKLAETLPTVGAILNQAHPITIAGLNLSNDLAQSFSRDRIATLLREQFPNLSEEVRLEAVGSIVGIDMGRKRISVESNSNASVAVEERNGDLNARIFMQGGNSKPASGASPKAAKPQPQLAAQPIETLSSADLGVLKRVK